MKLFRIVHPDFADPLNAEGARKYGGRWNPKGVGIIYYATTRSLAALELRAHVPAAALGREWMLIESLFPDHRIITLPTEDLPEDWNAIPAPKSTQELGQHWHQTKLSGCLLVPSTIIPEEMNALFNPDHPDIAHFQHIQTTVFRFDERLSR